VVGGVFETAPMIENILSTKVHLAELDIYVFDPAGSIGNRLIYWHSTAGRPVPSESALLAAWHWQGTLQLADQQWGVIFAPTETFARGAADWTAMAALATGLAITATIAGYLWLTLRRTRQLENLTASLGETTEELRRNGAKLDHLARHDALTGLPNRTLFRENIAIGLRNASRGHGFAVLYLDLDRFKTVNDTLGHQAGDQLLCQVADRLHDAVRETDTITRLGGDEFAIAQCMADQPGAAEMLARRVIDLLSSPYKIGGHLVVVGVSVGITLAGRDDLDADHLLRRADMALYAAKRSGRGTWRFFQPLMEQEAQARRGLEMDLRHALQHKEFELYYQPQVHVADGRVVGFEALLRWNHPDRGLVGPGDFLRCAEESGLILPIGDWVLMTALKESASWPAGVRVAVNISSHQLGRDDLAAAVQAALSASRQTGMRLELEVTEGALIEHQGTGQAALRHLRDLGVHIALDDFGTGHASLSHLRSFPFDRIKIDQSFVAAITESPEGATIVRSILQFAANLNITTTGEGVERPEQLALLAAMGCCEAQGFLFSPARPASEVPRLLAGWPTLARDAVSSTVTSLGPAARIVPAAVHVDP
jgi:diguanylate cyclase (GGDEF)-like protein